MGISCSLSATPAKFKFTVSTYHQIATLSLFNSCSTHWTKGYVPWQHLSHCFLTRILVPLLFALEANTCSTYWTLQLSFFHILPSHPSLTVWFCAPSHQSVSFLQLLLFKLLQFFKCFGLFFLKQFIKLVVSDLFSTPMLHANKFVDFSLFYVHSELFLTAFDTEPMLAGLKFKCHIVGNLKRSQLYNI